MCEGEINFMLSFLDFFFWKAICYENLPFAGSLKKN